MRNSWKAGSLYIVSAPSTKTKPCSPSLTNFRREIGRRGGAGAHQLPQWDRQIVVRAAWGVEERIGVVAQRPRRIRSGIAHHDQQQCLGVVAAQCGVAAEHALQQIPKPQAAVAVVVALPQRRVVKHLLALGQVEIQQLRDT